MNFKHFISELALNPEHEKKYKALGKKIKYQDRYKEIFGKKDRIYLPVKGSIKLTKNDKLESQLIHMFNDLRIGLFKKIDYDRNMFIYTGVKKNMEVSIEEVINDYYKKHGDKDNNYKNLWLGMLKANPSSKKKIYNKLMVVISRNPCDIAGMSTNRGWKSCMNLYSGMYKKHVDDDVREGTLVAYLIDSEDKDIEHPIGRLLIKPYSEISSGNKYLKVSDVVYGNFTKEAKDVVKKWIYEHQKEVKGFFIFNNKLYLDGKEPASLRIGIPKTKGLKFDDFKVGDKVLCIEPPDNDSRYVGKKGVVVEKNLSYGSITIHVNFGRNNYWWCEPRALQIIK